MPYAHEHFSEGNAADLLAHDDHEIAAYIRSWLGSSPLETIAKQAYIHASGFIVLRAADLVAADGESQARIHYWPLDVNDPNPDKRIHSHGCNLSSRYLHGKSRDDRFTVSGSPLSPHGRYAIESTTLAGQSSLSFEEPVAIQQIGQTLYEPGNVNMVPPDAYHDTRVDRGDVLTLCITERAAKAVRSNVIVENSNQINRIQVDRRELTVAEADLMYTALQRFTG